MCLRGRTRAGFYQIRTVGTQSATLNNKILCEKQKIRRDTKKKALITKLARGCERRKRRYGEIRWRHKEREGCSSIQTSPKVFRFQLKN